MREWLLSLDSEACKQIGSDIERVQWRWPISKPLVGAFGDGLYEVRTSLGRNEYRVIFSMAEECMVLLHGFQKRTQTTSARDLALAKMRSRQLQSKGKK